MYIIHDLEQKFLYRLGTCFHNTFILARFISFRAVWLRKKDQRDVGLDRNLFFQILLVLVGDQESRVSPASGGPGEQGLAQQRHLVAERGRVRAGRPSQVGPAKTAQLCVKGKLRLILCKLKYRETRTARVVYREKL